MAGIDQIRLVARKGLDLQGKRVAPLPERPQSRLTLGCRLLLLAAFGVLVPQLFAQSDFVIQTATPSFIGAGSPGATLVITGTLPDFTGSGDQVCFYAGNNTAPITPVIANGVTSIAVPTSTIQGIPKASFTAANNYSVTGLISIVGPNTATCDGTFDASLTNSYPEPISEPVLGVYSGPTSIPQTNSATNIQAPPVNLVLSGSSFTAATTVTLGSFGAVTPKLHSPSTISIAVPAALSSSAVGTTAAVAVCGAATYCSGAASTITLTVAALVPSAGTVTASPNPTTVAGTTVLTAQFQRDVANSAGLPEPGAPSGLVTFSAAGNTVGTAPLALDTTATFVSQTTTTTIPAAATPVIAPAGGTFTSAQTITITDATVGASIYYTADGSTPTATSTLYTGPFVITASQTINAVAVAAGIRNSAVATQTYTVRILNPVALAFLTQPVNTATGVTITPPVQVAVVDINGNTVVTSTIPVTLSFDSNPGDVGTLRGTLTQNAVNGVATFSDLSIVAIADGYSLLASGGGLNQGTSNTFSITPYPISVKLFAPLIGVTSTLPGTFTLSHPAPAGTAGVVVSLTSSNTSLVTVTPATVTIPAGGTTGNFTYTGVQPAPGTPPPADNNLGTATISAAATNYLTGTADVTETYSLVSLGTIPPVAPAQVIDLALSLATAAPAGGVTIHFTSSDPTVATITQSVFVPAGQRTAAANPQITGIKIGTTTVTATAQGYAPDTRSVNVTVVASFAPSNISINLATSRAATLNISAPAQAGGITFTLSSDDTTKVTVPVSVTIPAGQTSVAVPVTGIAQSQNYIPIRADSPGVTEAVLGVAVNSALTFYYATETSGVNMEVGNNIYLAAPSPTPTTVTITSSNPAVAILSKSPSTVGTATITYTNVTSQGYLQTFYIQGKTTGTTTLTVSAPGFTDGTATITVNPSGFIFGGGYNSGISTTTFSPVYGLTVYPAILNTDLSYYTTGTLSPGITPANVIVTSSATNIGTITTSPVVFNPTDTSENTGFQPAAAGTSTIALGAAPAGFSKPTNYQSFTATVTAPALSFYYPTERGGVNMQVGNNVYLPVGPPSAETVTITSSNPAVAVISKDTTTVGVATLTFPGVTNAGYQASFYIQGKTTGTTTLTVSAPGYTDATSTITITPSGFLFSGAYNNGISTTTFSAPYGVTVYPAILNNDLSYYTTSTLSPGVGPVSIPVTSTAANVGTITTSPIVFNAGDSSQSTGFNPVGSGTSTIALGTTPAGFSKPTTYQSFTATVTAPSLSFYYTTETSGVNLIVGNNGYLPVAPPSGETVTITSSNPAVAVLSKDTATVGVATLTYPGVTNAGYQTSFYIQGKTTGTTTLTISAPGYNSATATITVNKSGFIFSGYGGGLSTTTFSAPTGVAIYPAILNPDSSYYTTAQLSPGVASVSVPVVSSNTVVGTISGSPVVFNAGDSGKSVSFQPTSAGTTTVSLVEPIAGYTTSTNYTSFTATVTAPALSFYYGNTTTGAKLQNTNNVYLPVAPPNPITVTVTANGATIATVSKDGTVVGGTSITFTNVTTSGYLPAFYIQGQATGSTTITASAPGYTNAISDITVNPSGFAFSGDQSFTTSVTSGQRSLTVYSFSLVPGTLTLQGNYALNPGLSENVAVTSSNTAVGTITGSPLVFAPTDYQHAVNFQPVATGTSTITVVPPAGFSTPSQGQQITATVQ